MKKAQGMTFGMIEMIPRIVFTAVVLITVVILVNLMIGTRIETNDIEADILANRLLYGLNGISHFDPVSGRVITGLIDFASFEPGFLDKSLHLERNTFISTRISVFKKKAEGGTLVNETFYNQPLFERLEPLSSAFINVPGRGGVYKNSKKYPVVYQDDSGEHQGILEITVLRSKS